MSYGGGYGRSRNGYGDSNGHTNGYALCEFYFLYHFRRVQHGLRDQLFPPIASSSAVTGVVMSGADGIATSAAICGMAYLSQPLYLDCFVSVEHDG
jgi:hypothetical protein